MNRGTLFSHRISYLILFLSFVSVTPNSGYALDPDEILVVVNSEVAESLELASFYMVERNIPKGNLVSITSPSDETCSRENFETTIRAPIRKFLKNYLSKKRIRCLVLMYGLPLRVSPPLAEGGINRETEALEQRVNRVSEQIRKIGGNAPKQKNSLEDELSTLKKRQGMLRHRTSIASVDSELMLVRADNYDTAGRLANPYFIGTRNENPAVSEEDVLMVSRLDGPSASIVRRMITDTLEVEKIGLSGKAYFDARWPKPEAGSKALDGYQFYDRSIHRAAALVEKSGRMSVVLEDTSNLFQSGQASDAALYCGWYSLARYVDAFTWATGAIGYHIASSECITLKKEGSQVWCKRMLEEGVAASIGPVDEPYVNGFPLPEIFFSYLVDGYLSLAECYLISLPSISWKMILLGDPLYRPFKALM